MHGTERTKYNAAQKLAKIGFSTRLSPEGSRTFKGLSGATETPGSERSHSLKKEQTVRLESQVFYILAKSRAPPHCCCRRMPKHN